MNRHIEHITTTKTARYVLSNKVDSETREIWFVLHGYAQLAPDFIASFDALQNPSRVFVAPEGLNRFYARGFGGKVAATWMTSEDRDYEISDYVTYLNLIYEQIVPKNYTGKIVLLGFSQGVATASCWLCQAEYEFDHFIICSGEIAKELREPVSPKLIRTPCTYITGKNDSLLRPEVKVEVDNINRAINATTITFDGGHEINTQALSTVII